MIDLEKYFQKMKMHSILTIRVKKSFEEYINIMGIH